MHPTTTTSTLTPAIQSLLTYLSAQMGGDAVRTIVQIPLLLIFLDLITGVASACKRSVFTTKQLSDFVGQDLVKYLICFLMVLVLSILFGTNSPYTLIALVPTGTLAVSVAGSIIENLRELFPGDTVLVGAVEKELETVVPGFTGGVLSPSTVSPLPPPPPPTRGGTPGPTASYGQLVQSLGTGTSVPIVSPVSPPPPNTM